DDGGRREFEQKRPERSIEFPGRTAIGVDHDQRCGRRGAHQLAKLGPIVDLHILKSFSTSLADLRAKLALRVQNQEWSENLGHKTAAIMWIRSSRAVAGCPRVLQIQSRSPM